MSTESSIKVGVCVSPLTDEEQDGNLKEIITTEECEVKVCMGEGRGQKSYEVDFEPFYFGTDSSKGIQSSITKVCSSIGNVVLDQAYAGFNTTLFTYGAKGTGKSSMLYGKAKEDGIITFTLKGLFHMAGEYDTETSFRCEISFFEICGDMITDLISKRGNIKSQEGVSKLKVKEDATRGTYVDKLSRHIVTDYDEAKGLYNKGLKSRNRLAALDPESKETSHSIFSIIFTQARLKDGLPMELISKVNIIDLASRDGYKGNMNGFNEMLNDEDSLEPEEKQGPLEVLNEVISALAAQNYGSINPMRSYGSINPMRSYGSINGKSGIPYDESNLTLLMKDALGGNCETIMLCCVSACEKSLRDTLCTLKHGNLARHIKNKPILNEDQNVKLIRELRDEIDNLKKTQTAPSAGKQKDVLRKLKRDQELMNRLTGIWEEKWSKAQQMIEDKSLNVSDIGGVGLKLETKEPHFVSLGGGRLSVGVSIIPVNKGFTRVGAGGDGIEVDLLIQGKGIASEHCLVEYDGDAVVLHPKNELVSIDGIPLTEPTRLAQGCMICLGRNNYFRFNHPREAAMMKEQYSNARFSIVPDGVYPDIQLAIEQRRKETQEKETLRAENKRLLAMEQQYMQALERLEFEKDQLEHEKTKLQILQQQQENVANQFDRNVSIQIEELKLHKQEVRRLQIEKEKIQAKEKEIEVAASKAGKEREEKEEQRKSERDRILSEQASLDLQEFEALEKSLNNNSGGGPRNIISKAMELESDKQRLALLELDLLTDDLEYHDQFQKQRDELDIEKVHLENMEKQHKELERNLSDQIARLQKEREVELMKIEKEKERLQALDEQQTEAIKLIELERSKLMSAKETEQQKLEKEREALQEAENERMRVLQKAVDDQEKERENIEREKMRLLDLEEEHKRALEELQQDMVSQQEKLERERKLELEYIETEQLMLEELEQRQFESARQMEYETQLIRHQVEREKEDEKKRFEANERYVSELKKQQELALKQAEDERRKMQIKREEEQRQLREEREKLVKLEDEYKDFVKKLENEKEELRITFQKEKEEEIAKMKEEFSSLSQSSSPSSPVGQSKMFTSDFDPNLLVRKHTTEIKMQQIEEERHRLSELKKQAAEKAEFEWQEKKREVERRETEEKEIETKKELLEKLKREQEMKAEEERRKIQEETEKMKRHEELLKQREKELAELHKERERREELERMLQNEKNNEHILEQTLNEEKERLTTLEKSFAEERSKRMEIERRLHEEESRNRLINEEKKKPHDTRSNGTLSTGNNGTLKRRVPSYTLSLRSGHSSGNSEEINLLHNIQAAGHVVENCPSVRINRYSCRGYLLKMGKSKLKISWKKRWFVFDRKLRALCYYQDERKTKSKGILYFQSIQEVYVDSSIKRSPNPKTTFCVRTPQRTYVLSASSPVAMSIWIDVICTGKEGVFSAMTL